MIQDGIASGNVRNIVVVLLNAMHQVLEKFVLSFKVGGFSQITMTKSAALQGLARCRATTCIDRNSAGTCSTACIIVPGRRVVLHIM